MLLCCLSFTAAFHHVNDCRCQQHDRSHKKHKCTYSNRHIVTAEKSTIKDMMIMTADKGFAIAVFTSAHLFSDMVREILCLTQTILRASMECVCSAHLPDASIKGHIRIAPLYIQMSPYIRPTTLLLLHSSFLLSFHICTAVGTKIFRCECISKDLSALVAFNSAKLGLMYPLSLQTFRLY